MIRLLTFTTLYPNAKHPSHGIFVENRLRNLVASGAATTTVLAPVPFVPSVGWIPRPYKRWSGIAAHEERYGIQILHPRYLLLPKASMSIAPLSLYLAAKHTLATFLARGGSFDLIDAHYFYPDGIAAVMLGRHFGRPVTITARGSDINILPRFRLPRQLIRWAAAEASGIVTVSEALKVALVELGVSSHKIRVLRNGVDLERFQPGDRVRAQQQLGFRRPTLLSVGNLIPLKGHDLAIKALVAMPDKDLAIVGEGRERANLEALAQQLGVGDRVRFWGRVAHDSLPDFYRAAEMLLLLSTDEGMPNVLLEALACGTPVVATAAGGVPEIITTPSVGELVMGRTADGVTQSIRRLLSRDPKRDEIRRFATAFGWEATTNGQLALFSSILDEKRCSMPLRDWPNQTNLASSAASRLAQADCESQIHEKRLDS